MDTDNAFHVSARESHYDVIEVLVEYAMKNVNNNVNESSILKEFSCVSPFDASKSILNSPTKTGSTSNVLTFPDISPNASPSNSDKYKSPIHRSSSGKQNPLSNSRRLNQHGLSNEEARIISPQPKFCSPVWSFSNVLSLEDSVDNQANPMDSDSPSNNSSNSNISGLVTNNESMSNKIVLVMPEIEDTTSYKLKRSNYQELFITNAKMLGYDAVNSKNSDDLTPFEIAYQFYHQTYNYLKKFPYDKTTYMKNRQLSGEAVLKALMSLNAVPGKKVIEALNNNQLISSGDSMSFMYDVFFFMKIPFDEEMKVSFDFLSYTCQSIYLCFVFSVTFNEWRLYPIMNKYEHRLHGSSSFLTGY